MHRVSWLVVLLAVVSFAPPSRGEEELDLLIAYIIDALEAPQVSCSPAELDEYPGRRVVCARYRGAFSSLKSDWELVMRHEQLPLRIRTEDAWTRMRGHYRIAYKHGDDRELLVAFDDEARRLRFAYDEPDVDFPGGTAPLSRDRPLDPGEAGSPARLAGFGGVSVPRVIEETRVEPLRSSRAQAERVVGTATLEIVVRADGTVRHAAALSEAPEGYAFGAAAVEAVRQWRFRPAMFEGQPVDAAMNLKIEIKQDPPPPGEAQDDAGKG